MIAKRWHKNCVLLGVIRKTSDSKESFCGANVEKN
jgi:hypothetical protein